MGEDTDFGHDQIAQHSWKIIIVGWCVTIMAFFAFFIAVS